jgi:23S rRNA (pseudouridine1915-N3)-methyltransferase
LVRIQIIAVGKNKDSWVTEGCRHFEKLLRRYATLAWTVLPGPKGASSLSPREIRKVESAQLLGALPDRGAMVALSDDGERHATLALTERFEKLYTGAGGIVTFVIGGPHGLDKAITSRADWVLSLSTLTFSHQLVRLVLLEQLYRMFSIIHHTGYHK